MEKTKRKQIVDKRDACQDMRATDRGSRQPASIDLRLSLTCLWSEWLRSYGNYGTDLFISGYTRWIVIIIVVRLYGSVPCTLFVRINYFDVLSECVPGVTTILSGHGKQGEWLISTLYPFLISSLTCTFSTFISSCVRLIYIYGYKYEVNTTFVRLNSCTRQWIVMLECGCWIS